MIAANKNPTIDFLFYRILRLMLRRSFHDISVRGRCHLEALSAERPTLAFANHSNWWDGLIVFFLTRFVPRKSFYCMMEEKQLREYRFFTWLGAFSVDPHNPLRAAAAVRYAMRLLERPGTMLWIFPQGELVSPHRRIDAQPGVGFLASRVTHAELLPVAFRYEFIRQDKPQVFIEVGRALQAHEAGDEAIAEACNEVASRLDQAIRERDFEGFERIMKPRLPINKKWEWVVRAVTGRLNDFRPEN